MFQYENYHATELGTRYLGGGGGVGQGPIHDPLRSFGGGGFFCQCVPFFVPCYAHKNGKVSTHVVAKMGFYDGFEWIR